MASLEQEPRRNIYVPPADNRFDYHFFAPNESPKDELLARQVQAQSYLKMKFVRPEGLVRIGADDEGNDIKVLSSHVNTPVDVLPSAENQYRTEYVLGRAKESHNDNPYTGQLVTWKKYYAPLEALPAYQFCKDVLDEGWEEWLRQLPQNKLVEIEAMGKTENTGGGTIAELMRNEIRRASAENPGEIWYFNIVDSTYDAFTAMWGPLAVRQIGDAKQFANPYVYDHVHLIPAIIDVDNFFANIMRSGMAPENPYARKQLEMFLYMTDGMDDAQLGDGVAAFRTELTRIIDDKENV